MAVGEGGALLGPTEALPRSVAAGTAPTTRPRATALGILAGLAVMVLIPLVFLVGVLWTLTSVPAWNLLMWGYQVRVLWILPLLAAIAATTWAIRAGGSAAARRRRHDIDERRLRRIVLAAQPVVVAAAAVIAYAGVPGPPAALGRTHLEFVSPLRAMWLVGVLEACVTVGARHLSRPKARRDAVRSSLVILLLTMFLVAPLAVQTCWQPIYDEVVFPLPAFVTVVNDTQGSDHSNGKTWSRSLELSWPLVISEEIGHSLAAWYRSRGWLVEEVRPRFGPVSHWYANSGRWRMEMFSDSEVGRITVQFSRGSGAGIYLCVD